MINNDNNNNNNDSCNKNYDNNSNTILVVIITIIMIIKTMIMVKTIMKKNSTINEKFKKKAPHQFRIGSPLSQILSKNIKAFRKNNYNDNNRKRKAI